jgi:copper chaperone CopZ
VKTLIVSALLSLLMSTAALADRTIYHIFADGLACQHCAVSIDKQLKEIEGVERVDVLPGRGIVNVRMADGYALNEKQVATVLTAAGVTFCRMEQHPVGVGVSGTGVTVPQSGIGKRENSL